MKHVVLGFALVLPGIAAAGQPAFVDEFDQVTLNARWEWYTPSAGPVYELDGANFILDMPSGNYDSWAGFDRCPRLRTSDFDTIGDFAVETHVVVEQPTTATYFQTGIWVGFQDLQGGPIDGWFWGFYSAPGWAGPHTLRVERVGNRSTGYGSNATPAPWGAPEAHLKIERIGERYLFYYKEQVGDAWILFHSTTSAGQTVIDTGVFAKNWGGLNAAVRASFDYFRLGDPTTVVPSLIDSPDATAFPDMAFCLQTQLAAGFPLPTWSMTPAPAPANQPTISSTGLIDWLPAAADLGKTFTFTVTATNLAGSDSTAVKVTVSNGINDDFNGPNLTAGLALHAPNPGPTVTLPGDGWGTLAHSGLGTDGTTNFDTWLGVDRMPRIQVQLPTCGDFTVETLMTAPAVTPGEPADYHAGIYVGFDDTGFDGFFYGPYRTFSDLKLERAGLGYQVIALGALSELALRIERRGDTYLFKYKSDLDWLDYGSLTFPGERVRYVGLCSKNWGGNPAVSVSFDYLRVGIPPFDPPVLEDLCPDAINQATVGDLFAKRLSYRAWTPKPTAVTVAPIGAFDVATGVYSVTPSAAGMQTITITAVMEGAAPVAVTFELEVIDRTAFFEDFEVVDIDDLPAKVPPRELYNPLGTDPPPFSIVGATPSKNLELAVKSTADGGAVYDSWIGLDNAPQVRIQTAAVPDELGGDFTIETKLTLTQYTASTYFQFGLAVGFGANQLFFWGPYMGTNVRLEYSGMNALYDGVSAAQTVTLRIRRECDLYYFLFRPEGSEWRFGTTLATPATFLSPPSFVGLFVKTWDVEGATATAEFEYLDIIREVTGPTRIGVRVGDANNDGTVNIADAVTTLGYLFGKPPKPAIPCFKAADSNDDNTINVADAIDILTFLFGAQTNPSKPMTGPDGMIINVVGCRGYLASDIPTTILGQPGCATPCIPPP